MMSVGIYTSNYPYGLLETADRIKRQGFSCVKLELAFRDLVLDEGPRAADACKRVADVFRDRDLPIVAISCFRNLVHPDPALRKSNIDRMRFALKHARLLGTSYVACHAGTYHPTNDHLADEKNSTEEGYQEFRAILLDLVRFAADHDAIFLLEPFINNVIGSIETTNRILAEIDHASLGLIMDPANYFDERNIDMVDQTVNMIFDAPLAKRVKLAHAKDVEDSRGDPSEKHSAQNPNGLHAFRGVGPVRLPGPGQGRMNYGLYLKRLSAIDANMPLIIEHLDETEIAEGKAFVDRKLKEAVG